MTETISPRDPLFAAMHAWRADHPQATLVEIEGEATRQVAAGPDGRRDRPGRRSARYQSDM